MNFGHRHPRITRAAHAQLDTVTLVSRAFHSDRLGPFCKALAALCRKDMVLPMNSGAEAVESGIKVARKWGADVKGVAAGQANIVVAENNFHGRTISIVSFSSDAAARGGFGPFTPGFRTVPYGDADAVSGPSTTTPWPYCSSRSRARRASSCPPTTICPACGNLHAAQRPDDRRRDPVRPCPHRLHLRLRPLGVVPDVYLLGKALGGGVVPLSAVVADNDVLGRAAPR